MESLDGNTAEDDSLEEGEIPSPVKSKGQETVSDYYESISDDSDREEERRRHRHRHRRTRASRDRPRPRTRTRSFRDRRMNDFDEMRLRYLQRLKENRLREVAEQQQQLANAAEEVAASEIQDVEMDLDTAMYEQQRIGVAETSASETLEPSAARASNPPPSIAVLDLSLVSSSESIAALGLIQPVVQSDSNVGESSLIVTHEEGHPTAEQIVPSEKCVPVRRTSSPLPTIVYDVLSSHESEPLTGGGSCSSQEGRPITIADSEEEVELEQLRTLALFSQRTPNKLSGNDSSDNSDSAENEFTLRAAALKTALMKKCSSIIRKKQAKGQKHEQLTESIENKKNVAANQITVRRKSDKKFVELEVIKEISEDVVDVEEGKENQNEGADEMGEDEKLLRQQLLETLLVKSDRPKIDESISKTEPNLSKSSSVVIENTELINENVDIFSEPPLSIAACEVASDLVQTENLKQSSLVRIPEASAPEANYVPPSYSDDLSTFLKFFGDGSESVPAKSNQDIVQSGLDITVTGSKPIDNADIILDKTAETSLDKDCLLPPNVRSIEPISTRSENVIFSEQAKDLPLAPAHPSQRPISKNKVASKVNSVVSDTVETEVPPMPFNANSVSLAPKSTPVSDVSMSTKSYPATAKNENHSTKHQKIETVEKQKNLSNNTPLKEISQPLKRDRDKTPENRKAKLVSRRARRSTSPRRKHVRETPPAPRRSLRKTPPHRKPQRSDRVQRDASPRRNYLRETSPAPRKRAREITPRRKMYRDESPVARKSLRDISPRRRPVREPSPRRIPEQDNTSMEYSTRRRSTRDVSPSSRQPSATVNRSQNFINDHEDLFAKTESYVYETHPLSAWNPNSQNTILSLPNVQVPVANTPAMPPRSPNDKILIQLSSASLVPHSAALADGQHLSSKPLTKTFSNNRVKTMAPCIPTTSIPKTSPSGPQPAVQKKVMTYLPLIVSKMHRPAATTAFTSEERIVVNLGVEESDDESETSESDDSQLEPETVEPMVYITGIDDLLNDARKRQDALVPSTPEAVHSHLPRSQRLEYIELKKKLLEKEITLRNKPTSPASPLTSDADKPANQHNPSVANPGVQLEEATPELPKITLSPDDLRNRLVRKRRSTETDDSLSVSEKKIGISPPPAETNCLMDKPSNVQLSETMNPQTDRISVEIHPPVQAEKTTGTEETKKNLDAKPSSVEEKCLKPKLVLQEPLAKLVQPVKSVQKKNRTVAALKTDASNLISKPNSMNPSNIPNHLKPYSEIKNSNVKPGEKLPTAALLKKDTTNQPKNTCSVKPLEIPNCLKPYSPVKAPHKPVTPFKTVPIQGPRSKPQQLPSVSKESMILAKIGPMMKLLQKELTLERNARDHLARLRQQINAIEQTRQEHSNRSILLRAKINKLLGPKPPPKPSPATTVNAPPRRNATQNPNVPVIVKKTTPIFTPASNTVKVMKISSQLAVASKTKQRPGLPISEGSSNTSMKTTQDTKKIPPATIRKTPQISNNEKISPVSPSKNISTIYMTSAQIPKDLTSMSGHSAKAVFSKKTTEVAANIEKKSPGVTRQNTPHVVCKVSDNVSQILEDILTQIVSDEKTSQIVVGQRKVDDFQCGTSLSASSKNTSVSETKTVKPETNSELSYNLTCESTKNIASENSFYGVADHATDVVGVSEELSRDFLAEMDAFINDADIGGVVDDKPTKTLFLRSDVASSSFVSYLSPLGAVSSDLDPLKEVCSHDLTGDCRDPDCPYQHARV